MGYYTYQLGNEPTSISDIENDLTLIFPNVSEPGKGGNLAPGSKVYLGRFQPNTVIGWFVVANGYKSNTNTVGDGNWLVFSNSDLNDVNNPSLKQHNVILNDQGTSRLVLGFEDILRDRGGDQDFNDALFFVTSNPVTAIDITDIPGTDDPTPNSISGLAWEDLNGNGIRENGEALLENIEVKLFNDSDALIDSAITNSNGEYKFANVSSGNYYIRFLLPANYESTAYQVGADASIDSDLFTLDRTGILNLTGNVNLKNIDAGIKISATPDLSIEKAVNQSNPGEGDQISYTLTVKNNGPGDAVNVEVTDILSAGLTFVSANGNFDEQTGVWTVGNLTDGESKEIKIDVTVKLTNTQSVDLGIAKDFNLFVLNDLEQPSSDTEGKVAVGRNAKLSSYSVGDKLSNSNGSEDVLVIGKRLEFTSGAVYGGNVVYGTTTNLPQDNVSITDGTLRKDNPIDFGAAKTSLKALSQDLKGYNANGTVTFEWGGLKLTGSSPLLNVFEVDGNELSQANDVQINVPNGSVVLVNINRKEVSWTGGLVVKGTAINNVIYNFHQATKLKIQGIDVTGSVLAPKAALNFPFGSC